MTGALQRVDEAFIKMEQAIWEMEQMEEFDLVAEIVHTNLRIPPDAERWDWEKESLFFVTYPPPPSVSVPDDPDYCRIS